MENGDPLPRQMKVNEYQVKMSAARQGHYRRSLQCVARRVLEAKRICALTRAGVSVASGIPDFRSPGVMYDTLRPELLAATERERKWMRQDPTAVVQLRLFRENPFPYLQVRRPFILATAVSTWKATIAHLFSVCCMSNKTLPVHGSLGVMECEFCKHPYPAGVHAFAEKVRRKIRDTHAEREPEASTSMASAAGTGPHEE